MYTYGNMKVILTIQFIDFYNIFMCVSVQHVANVIEQTFENQNISNIL